MNRSQYTLAALALAFCLTGAAFVLLSGGAAGYAALFTQAATTCCLLALVFALRKRSAPREENSADGVHVAEASRAANVHAPPKAEAETVVTETVAVETAAGEKTVGEKAEEVVERFIEPDAVGEMRGPSEDAWSDLARECVELFDELERHKPKFEPPGAELAEHVTSRLAEIFERNNVEVIAGDTRFDRRRHQPVGMISANVKEGAAIERTLSPGFAIGRNVLRRARVSLAP